MEFDHDVIVIGGGPAGSSAALVLGRSRLNVLLIDKATPRNIRTHGIHAFITRNGMKPLEFRKKAHEEVIGVGVKIHYGEVSELKCTDQGFDITLADSTRLRSKRVVMATGLKDTLPEIDGMDRLYGKSVFHCPFCDGWEMRDKKIGVIADGQKGSNIAKGLLTWSNDVMLFTHGSSMKRDLKQFSAEIGITVHTSPIKRLIGKNSLEAVELTDGQIIERDGIFFDPKPQQQCTLAVTLGCETSRSGAIRTDKRQRTGLPGLYVIGDAAADPNMVVIAAADGVKAALNIVQEMQKEGHWIRSRTRRTGR
jgi:thioredoxin reductase